MQRNPYLIAEMSRRRLTVRAISEQTGLSRQAISACLNDRGRTRRSTITLIAGALDIDPATLRSNMQREALATAEVQV